MEQYTQESTVKLFKIVVGKSGNIYFPGIYGPHNPLPEKFMTPQYVELIEGDKAEQGVEKEKATVTTINESAGLINEVILNTNENKVKEVDLTSQPVKQKEEIKNALNINEATKSQIVALQGVGAKTADRIIELRELFPFSSHQDLNERVSLNFGRDWKEFDLEF